MKIFVLSIALLFTVNSAFAASNPKVEASNIQSICTNLGSAIASAQAQLNKDILKEQEQRDSKLNQDVVSSLVNVYRHLGCSEVVASFDQRCVQYEKEMNELITRHETGKRFEFLWDVLHGECNN